VRCLWAAATRSINFAWAILLRLPLGALARVGLARAYADFFALWKDADPDIPILKEAKAEYAKLQ
jgi:hypothetical protein